MCSASTIAWRMSSSAMGGSAISPFRTPRDFAWPSPTMFSALSAPNSPTTAQTFEVPISSPTMMEEGSNMLFLVAPGFREFGRRRRNGIGLEPTSGDIVADGEVEASNGLAEFLAGIDNLAPAPQLLIQIDE